MLLMKLRTSAAWQAWDSLTGLLLSLGALLAFAFGKNSVGFLVLILLFCLIEMFALMLVAGLDDMKFFGWKEFVRCWLMKALLLMIPLVGAAVDWAWYIMMDPDSYLGANVTRYTTKAMLIGVLGYQLREVLRIIITVYSDLPFLKLLMHEFDKMMRHGQDPPYQRREYDPPYEGGKNVDAERQDRL
jgi:hypothetical protein